MPHRSTGNLGLVVCLSLAVIVAAATTDSTRDNRPNILLLLTDDQDVLIGGMEHMPLLRQFMTNHGTTFSNYFVHTPICCPSRSSILSGRYLHNLQLTNNTFNGNCYGKHWQATAERETFAVYAQRAGYQTAFAGKYLNQYGRPQLQQQQTAGGHDGECVTGHEHACRRVPPGWDHWIGLVGNSRYYDYKVVVSDTAGAKAKVKSHGTSYKKDYLPDLVARRTMESIRHFSNQKNAPFLIMTAWPTPHGPFTPAPQDEGRFAGYHAHRTPNWNSTDAQNAKKHWLLRQLHSLSTKTAEHIDHIYQLRQESLQTIDRHVALFVKELERLGQLDNTIIIYTSDNGFQLGQHRLPGDKRHLYEHDIRVPMIVRGPGFAKNASIDEIVLNVDLAPTIVELTADPSDAHRPPSMDGQSFLPLLYGIQNTRYDPKRWRTDFLVSYHGEGDPTCGLLQCPPVNRSTGSYGDAMNNTYHCLRTMRRVSANEPNDLINTMYCEFVDDEAFVEYYDLSTDPWQLHNSVHDLSLEERFALEARLAQLRGCRGPTCRDMKESTGMQSID